MKNPATHNSRDERDSQNSTGGIGEVSVSIVKIYWYISSIIYNKG